LAFDTGEWAEQPIHAPLAVAAGITVEKMEAYRDGRLEDLSDVDRQQIAFIHAFFAGEVTEELWRKQVEVEGSERGVVEQMLMAANLYQHFRKRQAYGAPKWPDSEYERF